MTETTTDDKIKVLFRRDERTRKHYQDTVESLQRLLDGLEALGVKVRTMEALATLILTGNKSDFILGYFPDAELTEAVKLLQDFSNPGFNSADFEIKNGKVILSDHGVLESGRGDMYLTTQEQVERFRLWSQVCDCFNELIKGGHIDSTRQYSLVGIELVDGRYQPRIAAVYKRNQPGLPDALFGH